MSNLLQKIKLGTNNIKIIDWPGSDVKVALRILSQQEIQEAVFATERLFKDGKIDINMITADEYDSEKATQVIYRSLRTPENMDEKICANITEFRSSLTKEEKVYLVSEYLTFEKDCSPSTDKMTEDEFDKFLLELKKKPEVTLLNGLSSDMLKRCIITMASMLGNLQTPKSGSTLSSKKRV